MSARLLGGMLRRVLVVLGAVFLTLLAMAPGASAHPLGNFTVNSYSGLVVQPDAVVVQLVVDSAEIPTVQEFPDVGSEAVSQEVAAQYAAEDCDRSVPGLVLTLDGARQPLGVASADLSFAPGQAGLSTMRLECRLETTADVETSGAALEYVDRNSLDRTGWREITLVSDGVALADATAGSDSVSGVLTSYPADLLTSPLDQRSAAARVTPGTGIVSGTLPDVSGVPGAGGTDMGLITKTFTDLVSNRDLGIGFAIFALGLSIVLGALHAFAPGHGKTLMAAYLLGQRSSLRQVGIIGLTVTLTHTAGVLVLGLLLSTVAVVAPERVYGWLGLASGLLLVGIGMTLLRQAVRRSAADARARTAELAAVGARAPGDQGHQHDHGLGGEHGHGHGHGHDYEPGEVASAVSHSHGLSRAHTHPAPATSARGLVAVGFAGGMVPSPSALIVLLGGIALGRVWFGVLLVVGYGVGMALALIGTGLVLARSRDHIARWAERHRREGQESGLLLPAIRYLPIAAASLVIVVGLGLAVRAAVGL